MVRTYWNATLLAVLALPALVWGQRVSPTAPAPAAQSDQAITVKEAGKPEQRCRILKVWRTPEGATARQVQALDTGEIMTIVEIGPGGTAGAVSASPPASSRIVTRIFHWGHNQTAPPGVPAPPTTGGMVVSTTPAVSGRVVQASGSTSGTPTRPSFSGMPVVSASGCSSCTPTFAGTQTYSGTPVVFAPGCNSGTPTFSGTQTYSGTPVVSAPGCNNCTPAFSGTQTYSGTPVVSAPGCNSCTPTFSGTQVVSAPYPGPSGTSGGTVVAGPCTSCQQGTTVVTGSPTSGSPTTVTSPVNGSSTVVSTSTSTSTQEHVPFWKRWFQREPYTIPTQPPAGMARYTSTTPSQTSLAQVPAKKPDDTTTASTTPAKKPVDMPQPTDWRRSWGKADLSQAQAPAKPATDNAKTQTADSSKTQDNSKKPATDKKTVAQQEPVKQLPATKPATTPAKPALATNTPKPNTTTSGKEAPGSVKGMAMDLPHADTKKADPLNTPDRYGSKQLETKLKDPAATADAKKTDTKKAEAKNTDKTEKTEKKTEVAVADSKETKKDTKKKTEKVVTEESASAPGSSSTHPNLPLGAQSVLAAYEGKPGAVCYLPVPMVTLPASVPPGMTQPVEPPVDKLPAEKPKADGAPLNAFTAASSSSSDKSMANAFSSGVAEQPQAPAMGYSSPGMMMPPPMAMMPGMPMRPGTPGPVAQAGYVTGPNGMVVGAYCMPGQPGMTSSGAYPMPSMAPAMPVAEMQNVGQLLLTMRDSVYPSYREWAAEALTASGNNQHNPQVVEALVAAAKDDPAATVRATCLRCLVKMHVNTAPAVTTIQGLKSDPDPRVRSAAEQALTSLGIPQSAESPLQPASATAPADKPTAPPAGPEGHEGHE
jgi:hypothetical protein